MTEPPPDDLPDAIRRDDAARRAREAAIAPPPRPPRRTNASTVDIYVETAVRAEVDVLARMLPDTGRNQQLNTSAFSLGQLVGAGVLDRSTAESELINAARACGLDQDRKGGGMRGVRATLKSGLESGIKQPRDMSDVGQESSAAPKQSSTGKKPASQGKKPFDPGDDSDDAKTLKLRQLSGVKSRVPMWVWEYGDKGRIQLGTLSMFAGKPSAGKSTAVRWFAARLSKGELPGVWFGNPMKVAVVMSEEQTDAVVVPGLAAADADLRNIYTPEIRYGDVESGFTTSDMLQLQEELLDMQVRAVFIDPIMSTFGGKADIYRNNEVREKLAPFTRMAGAINGIVVGVTHLTKGQIRDVLGGMNGSAAFGEVPRAVFGFAPLEDGNHVLEQVKNSAGVVGLKLNYQLPISYLTADDGQPIDLPRFEITGETEISISDINPSGDETTDIGQAKEWLKMYLLENQPMGSSQIKLDAKKSGDIMPWTLKRAMKELKVKVFSQSTPGKPRMTVWALPDFEGGVPRRLVDD